MGIPVTRRRTWPSLHYGGTTTTTFSNPSIPPTRVTTNFKRDGVQVTTSEGNSFSSYKKKHGRAPDFDSGSNFYTSKVTFEGQERRAYSFNGGSFRYDFYGDVLASAPQSSTVLPPLSGQSLTDLLAAGTTAIARCSPTNPVAGLANFVGELLRDGVPYAPGADTANRFYLGTGSLPKGVAGEVLNLEFAVKPTLSDIRRFAQAVKDHEKILRQYERDSGKPIHRTYSYPPVTTRSQQVFANQYPAGTNLDATLFTPGTLIRETETTVERWFSGSFCYYLKLGDSMSSKLIRHGQLASKLLDQPLTAEIAWNLAPWSWAADWVSNMGDVFHNISMFQNDGLVMRYGYIMEKTTSTVTDTLSGYGLKPNAKGPITPLQTIRTQVRKVRQRASPFGFGVTDLDFSPRQLAIIAALGITRNVRIAK